ECRGTGRPHLPGHHPGLRREDLRWCGADVAAGDPGRRRAEACRAPPARRHGRTLVMLREVVAWLADNRLALEEAASRHLLLSATALAAGISMALPLALALVHWQRLANVAIGSVNVLRTIPSLALLAAMLPLIGTGFLPSVIALTLYGLPAILINSYTALREVDPDIVEAGLGQG